MWGYDNDSAEYEARRTARINAIAGIVVFLLCAALFALAFLAVFK